MEIDMVDNRRCNNETLLSYFPKFLQVQYVFFYNLFKFLSMSIHEAPIGCRKHTDFIIILSKTMFYKDIDELENMNI